LGGGGKRGRLASGPGGGVVVGGFFVRGGREVAWGAERKKRPVSF